MKNKSTVITIDGPSGVGKSTVSRRVASGLGYTYLDTGAMYRGVALYFYRQEIDPARESQIAPRLKEVQIELLPAESAEEDVGVVLNNENVSSQVRTPELSMVASAISALPSVRRFLTEMQRKIAAPGRIVAEGRDMGTVVFPEASHKFFLDADAEERCHRRVEQLRQNGERVDEAEILRLILERDKNDSERTVAPLKKAVDALLIDTTALSVDQVCHRILTSITKGNP